MKRKGLLLWVLGFLSVFLVLLVLKFAVFQSSIGYFPSQAKCVERISSNSYCGSGLYACTPCSAKTLPYKLVFKDSGVMTNKVWTSDCWFGLNDLSQGHTFCSEGTVSSHVGSGCYNNDLYWYNSRGEREDKKKECGSAGCSVPYPGGLSQGSCNAVVVTDVDDDIYVSVGAVCMPSSDYLCTDAKVKGGVYYCDIDDKEFCTSGCSNGACNVPTCSNECGNPNDLRCTLDGGFQSCQLVGGCLKWTSKGFCASGRTCSNGYCVPINVVVPPDNDTLVDDDGVVGDDVVISIDAEDLCDGVVCPDLCTADFDLKTNGVCDVDSGKCVYKRVVIGSDVCLPVPVGDDELDSGMVVVPDRAEKSWLEKYWGEDEKTDMSYIAEHGAPFDVAAGNTLFRVL